MLRLQAPSSSNSRSRRRHSAALSPAAALLLIHGVSGSIADNDGDAYRRRLFESEDTTRSSTINDEATIDWVAFAAETNAIAHGRDSTSVSVAASSTVRPSAAQRTSKTTQLLNTVGNDGSPSQFYPLGLCQGDCDNDNECAGDLVCHQRERNDAVPGCEGGQNDGEPTDFCILPNITAVANLTAAHPSAVPTPSPTPLSTTAAPMPLIITMTPPDDATSLSTSRPTVAPTPSMPTPLLPTTNNSTIFQSTTPPTSLPTTTTPTVQPTAKPTRLQINKVGNDGSPPEVYPLGLCQGDCDNDDDCAGYLICHQRDRKESVPGCAGGRNNRDNTDYCILPPTLSPSISYAPSHQPSISTAPSVSHAPSDQPSYSPTQAPSMDRSPPVRLRLYWTRDSKWQDSTRETYWCLQCRYGSCKKNSIIEVDWCSRSSKRQRFQYYEGDKTIRPMTNPSLCFEENGWNSEFNPIKLKRCNGSSRQRWRGFKEKRGSPFEFKSGRNSKYCMTQQHHPKAHERVYPQRCERARNHKTSKWVVF